MSQIPEVASKAGTLGPSLWSTHEAVVLRSCLFLSVSTQWGLCWREVLSEISTSLTMPLLKKNVKEGLPYLSPVLSQDHTSREKEELRGGAGLPGRPVSLYPSHPWALSFHTR